MRRKLLDVDQLQAVPRRQALDGHEREVREVLVVDRVELVLRHQPLEVRKLQRDHAFRLQQERHAGDEVVEVGHLGQDVVADDQIGALPSATSASASATPKNSTLRRNALVDRDLGDVGGRFDAEHRHAERQEMLQQIAVVARELDDQAVRSEAEPLAIISQ